LAQFRTRYLLFGFCSRVSALAFCLLFIGLPAVLVEASFLVFSLTYHISLFMQQRPPAELTPKMLEIGVLCNDAPADSLDHEAAPPAQTGDPLEVALLRAAQEAGLDIAALRQTYPLHDEFTFDTDRKMMSVIWETGDGLWVAVKGAPEAILARSVAQVTDTGAQPLAGREREAILAAAEMAQAGLRVLAFAERRTANDPLSQPEAESNLTFVGRAALADPPRPEVKAAITACRHPAGYDYRRPPPDRPGHRRPGRLAV
jgi:Ca2+-transporting ATPase